MTKKQAIEAFRHELRKRGKAYSTEKTYLYWLGQYSEWLKSNAGAGPVEWLSYLADPQTPGVNPIAVSTQKQALNAVAKFHQWVLKRPRENWNFKPARNHRKIPDFLTHSECHALFGQMRGVPQLQAQLMFGTGLRVSEALALRVKDLDFQNFTVTVRDGKGSKDRVLPMPRCLADQLQEQVEKAHYFWKLDRDENNPAPYLPASLEKKLGKQVKGFSWFWIFPASKLSTDPRSGIVRRHHLSDRGVAKAIKVAAKRAGITKRVHPHILRHSFATESLRGGLDIKSLATLMGHKSTATTEIYLHCLPDIAFRAVSPLDAAPSNVTPFVENLPAIAPVSVAR